MLRYFFYPLCLLILVLTLVNCAGSKKNEEYPTDLKTVAKGEELFNTSCASCHGLEDEGIGPRLGGVTRVLSKAALTAFIQNPAKVIESGDARAVSHSRKYKLVMPSFDFLKPADVNAILAYVDHETKSKNIGPLMITKEDSQAPQVTERLAKPIVKSGLKIEMEDFVTIPASGDKPLLTRIANMRPHPSADGSLYVSDQRGIISRISNGQVTTFLDIRSKIDNYVNVPGLGTGLGSFAFHPDFLHNGLIYITYTESFKGKRADFEFPDSIKVALQWVVSEWKINDVKSNVFEGMHRELLRINVPGNVHGTQDIEFIPGIKKGDSDYGMLYIGTGDGGTTIAKHPELCHKLSSLLGTIIRIDPLGRNSKNGKYGIPADNPFVNNPDPATWKEIWAYGFRNPHRMSWDLEHGKIMFSAEVGESNFEEVNVIQKGGDYGWNVREGNYGIRATDLKNVYKVAPKDRGNYIVPFAQYDHVDGAAISGGYVYEGNLKELKDKYVFGDIVSGRLFYVNINQALSDSTIHEITIMQDTRETDLRTMSGNKRVDVRIEYNPMTKDMYIMTKSDGKIRRIAKAYFK